MNVRGWPLPSRVVVSVSVSTVDPPVRPRLHCDVSHGRPVAPIPGWIESEPHGAAGYSILRHRMAVGRMYRAAAHSAWPGLISTLLGGPPDDRGALLRVALGALAEAVRADTVQLVEWTHGQPTCLATTGRRLVLDRRLPP